MWSAFESMADKSEKVTANQLVQLVKFLPQRELRNQKKFLAQGLIQACAAIATAGKQRTHEVDMQKVEDYIKSKLQNCSKLENTYKLMEEKGRFFAACKNSSYATNSYQQFIAAKMVTDNHPKTVLKLCAGQGKTFIIMMITQYYISKRKTVQIVVPSKTLEAQMRQYLDTYIGDDKASVCAVTELKHEEKEPDVFICDEYDWMLEKCAVSFGYDHTRKPTMFGLAPVYHSSKAYFLSATCDIYVQKLLKHIFDIKEDAIIEMPMVLEISTG